MSMKSAPSVDSTKTEAVVVSLPTNMPLTKLGAFATGGTTGGVGQVLYSQAQHTFYVDKGTQAAAPTVTTSQTLANFFAQHAGHPLTHIGNLIRTNGMESADAWFCQTDKIICLDVTT